MRGPLVRHVSDLEQIHRDEWGRLVALLVARFRRLDVAEDGLADAFEAAARSWPQGGTPSNPAAWLLTAARRRILDRLRNEAVVARKEPLLIVDARTREEAQRSMADPGNTITDERLRLVLLCAHPTLAPESAAALTLRLVLGVPTEEIAALFLAPRATMAARLTRARQRLAGQSFDVPAADQLDARVATLATVAYLAFTSGYLPGRSPGLAAEGVRLSRLVHELLPDNDVLTALLALVLLQHSRRDTEWSTGCLSCYPTRTGHPGTRSRSTRPELPGRWSITLPSPTCSRH